MRPTCRVLDRRAQLMNKRKFLILVVLAIVGLVVYLWIVSGMRMRERRDRLERQSELKDYIFVPRE